MKIRIRRLSAVLPRAVRLAHSGLVAVLVVAAGMAAAQPPPFGEIPLPTLVPASQPAYTPVSTAAASGRQPPGRKSQAIKSGETPKGISPEAWSRIVGEVEARTYAVQADQRAGTGLLAGNPAQHLSARFTPRGVMLTPEQGRHSIPARHTGAATQTPGLPFRLHTQSVGGIAAQAVMPLAAANRVEYRHPGYTEWFLNNAQGLEQGWTLEAPASDGKSPPIRVGVEGARTVAENAEAIRIEDRRGKLRYRYAGLKAWDARHHELPATMHLTQPGVIEIAVDDRGAQYPITVDPNLTATLAVTLSDTGGGTDNFGGAVSIDGDTVVVGAAFAASQQGAAFVFSRNQGGAGLWGLAATLSDPAATNLDCFGSAVAVNGDTVVVGAPACTNVLRGAAYVYSRNQGGAGLWGLAATLGNPAAANGDGLGWSVAVDGDTAVVGAIGTASGQGAAYIYGRNQGGTGVWGRAVTLNDPAATSHDNFGHSVAVHGDTLVVGVNYVSFGSTQGAAYIYSRNQGGAGAWGLAVTLSDPAATNNDKFGFSVAVDGDTVVVGAFGTSSNRGKAYIYGRNQGGAGAWRLAATLSDPVGTSNDSFGFSVAVNGDIVVVGALSTSSQGNIFVYLRNQGGAGMWGMLAALGQPTTTTDVAIDGETLVTGSSDASGNQGRAYIYDLSGGSFTQVAGIGDPAAAGGDQFGNAVAVDGDTVVVGAYGTSGGYQGKAYIYSRNQGGAGVWGLAAALGDPAATNDDYFGKAVAVDGDTVVVGAPASNANPGKTYIYGRNHGGAGVWGLAVTLSDPGASKTDNFGYSVAVDGDTLVVGAESTNSGQGSTYIYSRNQGGTGSWGQVATLSEPTAGGFGFSVAVNGDTVVVGAFRTASDQGKSYIYGRNQGGAGLWGLAATLNAPAGGQFFGISVAMDGDTVVVGAESTNNNQGTAYIYNRNQNGAGLWGLAATLNDPAATSNDAFGGAVAVDGDIVVVGATGSGLNAYEGKAYVFSRNQGGAGLWGLVASLSDPGATNSDAFGQAIALDGGTVVVGAYGGDHLSGNAYIYSLAASAAGLPPSATTNLTATPGSGAVTLNWTAASNADTYEIAYSTAGGPNNVQIVNSGSATQATVSGLSNGVTYFFVVHAHNVNGYGPRSNTVSATPGGLPSATTNLTATPGNGSVTLSWTAATNATAYYIAYEPAGGGIAVQVVNSGSATQATVSGLSNGVTYYFVVHAHNGNGYGPTSNQAVATAGPPSATTNLSAMPGNGAVALHWTAASNAATYEVAYSIAGGPNNLQVVSGSAIQATVSGLSNGVTYYFVVHAHNAAGYGPVSNTVASTPGGLPSAPGNLTATPNAGSVTLHWAAATNATSYFIGYVREGGTTTTQFINNGSATQATVSGLTSSVTYYFLMRAHNGNGYGPVSNQAVAAPQ